MKNKVLNERGEAANTFSQSLRYSQNFSNIAVIGDNALQKEKESCFQ